MRAVLGLSPPFLVVDVGPLLALVVDEVVVDLLWLPQIGPGEVLSLEELAIQTSVQDPSFIQVP